MVNICTLSAMRLAGGFEFAPLHPIATEDVDVLQGQPDVRAYGNSALNQKLDLRRGLCAALEFEHLAAARRRSRGLRIPAKSTT